MKRTIQEQKNRIDDMTQYDLCLYLRFMPSEHPFVQDRELSDHFSKALQKAGGMTTAMSKMIGWEKPPKGLIV